MAAVPCEQIQFRVPQGCGFRLAFRDMHVKAFHQCAGVCIVCAPKTCDNRPRSAHEKRLD